VSTMPTKIFTTRRLDFRTGIRNRIARIPLWIVAPHIPSADFG